MPIILGGQSCADPRDFADICHAQRMPLEPWFNAANVYRNPIGAGPGAGSLLMSRASLTALGDLSTAKTLVFDDLMTRVTLASISITDTRCLTPGIRSDPSAMYLVSIADRRYRIQKIPAGTAYNVRDPSGSGYLTDTTNGGTAWTWQEMVDDLYGFIVPAGSLTLPYSPDGKPENFEFYTSYAWEALNIVCRRLGCGIVYDPIADTFTIVEIGATDAATVAALDLVDRFRVWDTDPLSLPAAKLPKYLNVVYMKYPRPSDGSLPYTINQQTLSTASPYADSTVYVLGDLGDPVESGQNLSTRAAERAAKWYQAASDSALNPLQRVYAGILPNAELKKPGKRIKAVAWYDRGDGLKTELYRGLAVEPPDEMTLMPAGDSRGDTALCKVTGAVVATVGPDSIEIYPAEIQYIANSGGSMQWTTGIEVWLVQRFNFPLTSGSCFLAKKSPTNDYTNGGDTRPIYMTTELEWCAP